MTQAVQTAQYGSNNVGLAFKNRIINGAMVIDQRNAGASVSLSGTAAPYVLDRWRFWSNGSGGSAAYTVQQSSVAPSGFTNSVLITQTASFSPTGLQYNIFAQYIEGYNTADLNWGTANAKTVTLSFWVRSSLTGTFGGAISNSAQDRSYPFTYTISAANTWEYKTITVLGDTSGTWLTNNGAGVLIFWQLGVGSSYLGTAGAWAGAVYLGATGATQITATNGATLYITGVQLEVGSTATSFDYRPYGTELALCQRYYEKSFNQATKPVENLGDIQGGLCTGAYSTSANTALATATFAVEKRASPTISTFNPYAAGSGWSESGSGNIAAGVYSVGTRAVTIRCQGATSAIGNNLIIHWTASIEL
jgi:hypothetical protein